MVRTLSIPRRGVDPPSRPFLQRAAKHWATMTPISISTMFSQLACFGV
jgi:hypothetical protein